MIQVRTCTASNCSDDAAGTGWQGPDGTIQTYFSEIHNRTTPATLGGNIKPGKLAINFADFSTNLPARRYFQYRLVLESEDGRGLCTYGSAMACSPEIVSVKVGPDHYPVSPAITYETAIPFYTVNTIAQTLGAAGCSAGVRYQLSINNSSWYYHNGTTWVSGSKTYTNANTLAQVNSYAKDFANMVGRSTLYVRVFLGSDGTQACELDEFTATGNASY